MLMGLRNLLAYLPEVKRPVEKRLSFKEKAKWTLIILGLFFLLSLIDLQGVDEATLQQIEFLSIVFGAEFGTFISLGVGPIVTSSIVLQLLNGAGILSFDTKTPEGRVFFQQIQKVLAFVFIIFQSIVYVLLGAFPPLPGESAIPIILQLMTGGVLILLMSEVIDRWGFLQGISLFIAAGVSKQLMIRLLSPLSSSGTLAFQSGEAPVGAIPGIVHFITTSAWTDFTITILAILVTIGVFAFAVFAQSMKVEVPLSFGRVRGQSIRWPLAFIYTSNIPVILAAALIATVQLWAQLLGRVGITFLGTYSHTGVPTGLIAWLSPPNLVATIFSSQTIPFLEIARALSYMFFLMVAAVIFSVFWVKTSGMDARSQAKQILSRGFQIPGFRRDERVLESLLNRYIPALTVMGGLTVGFLAATADVLGALTSGTGLLLTVMILYRLYEEVAKQHATDMNPMLRRFIE